MFMCHDYMPNGREMQYETTVGKQKGLNLHVQDGISEDEFVAMRRAKDQSLSMPSLILPRCRSICEPANYRPLKKMAYAI